MSVKGKKDNSIDARKRLINNHLTVTIAVSVLIWLIFMITFFVMNDIDDINFKSISEYITSDVYYSDGTIKHFGSVDFGNIKKGERVVINISIPNNVKFEGDELYLYLYNCIVDAYIDGNKVYQDDYDRDNISAHSFTFCSLLSLNDLIFISFMSTVISSYVILL